MDPAASVADGDGPVESSTPVGEHRRVAIIGAGFSGIAVGARLLASGIEDFVVLERADEVGGTWRDNSYPGAACDSPSHLYSLSFAPNPDWERSFSRRDQIWSYQRKVARETGVFEHIRFRAEVLDASWDDAAGRWVIATSDGSLTADVLVDCAGPLTEPSQPAIDGLETFPGPVFHSARWNHEAELSGRRVAVIGTGASAVQFIPQLQPEVERLVLFQRTPAWVMPKLDRRVSRLERRVLRTVPALGWLLRLNQLAVRELFHYPIIRRRRLAARLVQGVARAHLWLRVRDPELRAKLTPDFEIGCKRVLVSNDFYSALAAPNVDVITEPIREVRGGVVVTEAGSEHPVDAVVLGTGFEVYAPPIVDRIRGRDGRSLGDVWAGRASTYRATTIAGFPNLFRVCGMGTGLGHGSMIWQMESQAAYIADALQTMDRLALATLEVRPEAEQRYMARVLGELQDTVWMAGGCRSWYQDSSGTPSGMWPRSMWSFRRQTRRFDPDAYRLQHRVVS